jgi:glycosyltransferase involved in cell wall biosynthesis
MQEIMGRVSVIIPAYNAQKFIKETIESVKKQTYSDWELIVVNDGSTDDTVTVLENEGDQRIRLVHQANKGVSSARNNGLQQATGEFIMFLDADDVLTSDFIKSRLNFLKSNPEIGFTGGLVETFPSKSSLKKAAAVDPENEILFFNTSYATIPSNYLFRRKMLRDNNIEFNINLSSTADRFFILQVSRVSKGRVIEDEGSRLLYRIDSQSMSHNISPRLILDNEQFYKELEIANMLPAVNRQKFKSLYFYSLGLGFVKIRDFKSFIKYFWNSFISAPLFFMKLILKRATVTK